MFKVISLIHTNKENAREIRENRFSETSNFLDCHPAKSDITFLLTFGNIYDLLNTKKRGHHETHFAFLNTVLCNRDASYG